LLFTLTRFLRAQAEGANHGDKGGSGDHNRLQEIERVPQQSKPAFA
jgi:hypothetical protein